MAEYWNKEIETMPQDKIKELQLKLFNQQLERANKAPAYKGKLPERINSLDDVKMLPFTCKDDLRQNFPYGFLAVPREKIARFNASSGTTGIPTLAFFTLKDINNINKRIKKQLILLKMDHGFFQTMLPLGMSVGGYSYYHAIQDLGIQLVPMGGGNSLKQIQMLRFLKATMALSTPSLLMHVCCNLNKEEIFLKKVILIGEHFSNSAQKLLLKKYEIETFRGYGLTEMGGGVACECLAHNELHIFEDYFYCEIINPETGRPVPEGEYGELVVTPLQQEAMPLIRYRTRDITRFLSGDCPCGWSHRRIESISHRIDDMMIINGVNVFPSQIEECIYKNLDMATNYLIHIKEKDGLKKLKIDIELPPDYLNNSEKMKELNYHLMSDLKSYITVSPILNFIPTGTLPEIQGKAKRVVKDHE